MNALPGRSIPGARTSARRDDAGLAGLDDLVGYHLNLAYRTHLKRFASIGRAHDIRAPQFEILKLVYLNRDLKQTDLATALGKKPANLVTALDELERRRLLTRVPDPNDRRQRVVRLTQHGEALTRELVERYDELNRELRERFGDRELDELIRLLKRFAKLGSKT